MSGLVTSLTRKLKLRRLASHDSDPSYLYSPCVMQMAVSSKHRIGCTILLIAHDSRTVSWSRSYELFSKRGHAVRRRLTMRAWVYALSVTDRPEVLDSTNQAGFCFS